MTKRVQIDKFKDGRGTVLKASGPAINEALKARKITKGDTFRDNVTPSQFLKELEKKGVDV